MKYYRLSEDMEILNKWYLGEINDSLYIEQWGFTMFPHYSIDKEMSVPIEIHGIKTDFTENLVYGVPILSPKAKDVLLHYDIIFSAVNVLDNGRFFSTYYAIGVDIIDAIDEEKSKYIKYKKDDPVRPDREGDYKYFDKIVLNSSKIDGKHIFRIKGYSIYLVISEELKLRIESAGLTGFYFEEICVYTG
ncbi:imm11 family protein [Avibacterium sp. 21-594]|uniref:imm11 family protein n=1 Tax=Avibacterium sp. 21-594 TaxID=2911535 RepID=UPI002247C305|nr:DUF1629 domain-containing protein [Avibacterium sp. 21-594]MCW9715922.1 hypothetical protein [Avibacterium sp. 21-594]